jgi:MYXO-CTERM domain-containing protein
LDNTQKEKRENMKKLVLTGLFVVFAAGTASAEILYSQSFEDDSYIGGKYYDTGDAAVFHWLANNAGEAAVNGAGFNAWYSPFDPAGVGLVDGDYVGVTNYTGGTGGFYDGDQAYQMSDTDGVMGLDIDDFGAGVNVSFAIFLANTGYEDTDYLTVSYGEDVLLQLGDGADGGNAMETAAGTWIFIEATGVSGNLVFEFGSNSGSEAVFIDDITIFTGSIPAPGALALLGLAGITSRRRRK